MVNSWSVRLPILNLSLAKSRKSAGSERRSAVGPNRTLAVPRKRDFRAGPQFDAIYAIFCTPNLLPLGLNWRPPPTISDCHRISANQGGFQLPVILTRQDFGGPSRNRTGVRGFAVLYVTTPPSGLNRVLAWFERTSELVADNQWGVAANLYNFDNYLCNL